ncbi:MAG: hypothetical protein ACQEXJ_17975 [Myxococcota bacterium]
MNRTRVVTVACALLAVAFGVLTLRSGGAVLFGPEEARRAAGDYVPFVVWFNFLAGFAYTVAGIGLWRGAAWSARLAMAIAAATGIVYAAFWVHVAAGGPWETRTAVAMAVRTLFWVALSGWAVRVSRRSPGP